MHQVVDIETCLKDLTHVEGTVVPCEACSGQECKCYMWRRQSARASRRACPLHGHCDEGMTGHDQVRQQVVQLLHEIDQEVVVFPELGITAPAQKGGRGRQVKRAKTYYVDVFAVLGNGVCLAVEVDGCSHDNRKQKTRDAVKDKLLQQTDRVQTFA
eukprot:jgi/Ulvmu1/7398/UM036_0058.1